MIEQYPLIREQAKEVKQHERETIFASAESRWILKEGLSQHIRTLLYYICRAQM